MPWSRSPEWIRILRSHRATCDVLSYTILVAIIYCALYLAVGPDLLPGGNAWSTLLIFLAAHVGGALCGMVGRWMGQCVGRWMHRQGLRSTNNSFGYAVSMHIYAHTNTI
ncbi:hypothetical protein Vafri_6053 [Volvox africanus]|nr:hypothetical protein Vafri_6053 [Volvox africanus]